MIVARELRIGNLFIEKNTKTIIRVMEITKENVTFSGWFKNSWLAVPMPITQEYLLSLGAEKIPKNRFHVELYCFKDMDCTEWCVGYIDDSWFLFEGKSDAMCNAVNYLKLEYIHKLQNLLFEVANLELAIK